MVKILGLDISSSTIGWATLLCSKDSVILDNYGFIKPPASKKGSLAYRASEASGAVSELIDRENPEIVAIEAYANKFPSGRSTARTIIVLSVFNEVISIAALKKMGVDPFRYPVVTIRSQISKFSGKKISSKEECFDYIIERFDNFNFRKNRAGNIAKELYDEADAIAVALTCFIKEGIGD
tara:strand:- start:3380 stop:3922 length:543 start_codon:yes stop_codon:yes gene_type:complete